MSKLRKKPCTQDALNAELTALRQDLLAEYSHIKATTSPQTEQTIVARQEHLSRRIEEIADQIIEISQKGKTD